MDHQAVAAMCQIMGAFTQRQALMTGDADALFLPGAQLRLEDLDITVRGRDAIRSLLQDRAHPYLAPGILHLLHSPAFDAPDGASVVRGHWNTYSLKTQDGETRWGYLRFTVDFAPSEEGGWAISALHCLCLMWLEPWQGSELSSPGSLAPCLPVPIPSEQLLALRNLMGRFVQDGPIRAKALFAGTEEDRLDFPNVPNCAASGAAAVQEALDAWEALERENGMYLTHMTVHSPVFAPEGPDRARGTALSLVHSIQGHAFGHEAPPYGLTRQIALLDFTFLRQAGEWKLGSARLRPLLTLAREDYTFDPAHRQLMVEPENRVYAPAPMGPPAPEDAFAIESIMAHWVEGVKRPDHERFAQDYMDTRLVDPSMHFSFDYIGYDAVAARCRDMIGRFAAKNPTLWRYPQFHSANTPVIEVSPDGTRATASWFDFGWGNIGVAVFYDEAETHRQYFPGAGKYYHSLIKEDGRWKIYRFFWRPLMLSLPAWDFDTRNVGGWSAHGSGLWPLPLEDYTMPRGDAPADPGST